MAERAFADRVFLSVAAAMYQNGEEKPAMLCMLLACTIQSSRERNKHCMQNMQNATPILAKSLGEILKLILQENSFQFNGRNYLQNHGTAMGTKVAVAFAHVFMSKVESEIISESKIKVVLRPKTTEKIILFFGFQNYVN